ncbi:MAG: hypothetical protein ACRDVP_03140 [Acidimicrobiales bacterium]
MEGLVPMGRTTRPSWTTRFVGDAGVVTWASVPRINAADHLMTVRSFYLDLTEWADDDPARWGPWVHRCRVSATEIVPRSPSAANLHSLRHKLPVPTIIFAQCPP